MQKNYSTVVEGMTCSNCALTIFRLLEKKGATEVAVNAGSGEVHFNAEENVDVSKLYDAVDQLGYHVVRESDNQHAHAHHHHAESGNLLLIICVVLTLPLLSHMFIHWPFLHNPWFQFALATPVFAIGCYQFVPSAWRSVLHLLPNMNVLIIIGAAAAYIYSLIGLFFFTVHASDYIFFETTAAIITLVMAGNWLELKTTKSTTAAIDALAKLQPEMAKLVMVDSLGKETITSVESRYLRKDDVVLINSGDAIPVDGEIIFGSGDVDERMITGESAPVYKEKGTAVIGGTLLQDGNIKLKATNVGANSVLYNIIRMVRDAQALKSPLQKLADKISAVFVPAVLLIAIIAFFVNYYAINISFSQSLMRAIAVLVISCPCAMGLATPAAVAVGLGRAARNGILIKGGDTLERLKQIKQIVFDKTGTLTTGELKIASYETELDENNFKTIVASIEKYSTHPVAKSIYNAWKNNATMNFSSINEMKGKGMEATDENGNTWQLGSAGWLANNGSSREFDIYLFQNNTYKGGIKLIDEVRDDAATTIAALRKMNFKTILLSGDRKEKAEEISQQLQIDEVYAEQSPEEKNKKINEWNEQLPTAMVGDGINDAPALARASVGISLSDASHIAVQSANIILSNNHLLSFPKAIKLGIYTSETIKQNLFWAFLYNVVAIPFAGAGYLSPTWGAGIMALSDVVLILNSLRLGIRRLD